MMVARALQTIKHLSGEDERMGVKLLDCKRCGAELSPILGDGLMGQAAAVWA
jgi:hypothetical protein